MNNRVLNSEKTQRLNASIVGRKVINILAALFFSFVGSAAIVLTVDYFIFRSGTWVGWTMTSNHPSYDDVVWWQSQVGPLPPPTTTRYIVMPDTIVGRTGFPGRGMNGASGSRLPDGLLNAQMKMGSNNKVSKWIRGSVLISPNKHVWHMGVELPGGMAFERIYIGEPGVVPKHPTYGTWDFRIAPIGLAINSLFVAAPFFLLMIVLSRTSRKAFSRIMGLDRQSRDRCEVCAYVLIAGQNPCPECGYHRKLTSQVGAN